MTYRDVEPFDRQQFIESAARAMFVSAWADRMEEQGESFSGMELMDVAPDTPPAALKAGRALAQAYERANGRTLRALWKLAVTVPGKHYREPTVDEFGHYFAMQSLGHGVGWFDDHPDFPLVQPDVEFYVEPDGKHVWWEVQKYPKPVRAKPNRAGRAKSNPSCPFEAAELRGMRAMLRKAGYDPAGAKKLRAEGMGPEELAERLKERGGLVRTHRLERARGRMRRNGGVLGQIGDVNAIEYGGGVVFAGEDGAATLEFTHGLETDHPDYDSMDEGEQDLLLTVYSVDLGSSGAGFYDWHDWVDWKGIASFTGQSVKELRGYAKSDDPMSRAMVAQDIGSYHGWHELDQYPESFSVGELEERWATG